MKGLLGNPLVIIGIIVVLIAAVVLYKKSKNGKPGPSLLTRQPPYNSDLVNAPMEGSIANPPLAGMARSGCSKCSKGM
jgi:hypothetical protein